MVYDQYHERVEMWVAMREGCRLLFPLFDSFESLITIHTKSMSQLLRNSEILN